MHPQSTVYNLLISAFYTTKRPEQTIKLLQLGEIEGEKKNEARDRLHDNDIKKQTEQQIMKKRSRSMIDMVHGV